MRPVTIRFAIALAILLLTAGISFGQAQKGSVYGTVVDDQGSALPGVTVEVTGVGAAKVQITDAAGQFRFLALDPGTYALSATLEGFSTVEHPNVTVNVNRNTTLQLQLTAAVEEVITVTSESPLLDERKVQKGTTISQVELEKIPTARDPWAIVTQTPGVLSDRINVGGNESGQQANFIAPGTSDDENTFAVDGVNITDMAAVGASPTYYDFDQFEEMQVSTGGSDIEKVSAGAAMNLVTKRGSNTPRGSGRYLLTEADEQFGLFEQGTPDFGTELENGDGNGGLNEQTLSSTPGNAINEVLDFGFEAGGPIVRDRLWIWASYGRNDIKQFAQSGDPDNTLLENSAVKLNAQPAASNSAVFSWNRGDKIKDGRRAVSNLTIEGTWDQSGPTELWKIEDTHVFTSSFYLTGLYSYVDGGFALQPKGGPWPAAMNTQDSATAIENGEASLQDDGLWHSFYGGASNRNTDNYQLDGSYFFNTGDLNHELKFGVSYRHFLSESSFGWPGGRNNATLYCEAIATCGFFTGELGLEGDDVGFVWRSGFVPVEQDYTATWLQDTMTWGNLTLNFGLRYDLQEGENPAATVEANPLFPTVLPNLDFSGNDGGGFEFETISPRLGATWALGAERKTLLRASFSRFAEQLSSGNLTRLNPTSTASFSYVFDDVNDNRVYDVGEGFTVIGVSGFDINDPTALSTPNENDPGLDPSLTDEVVLGVEHAFLPEFVVGFDLTYRLTSDIHDYQELIIDQNGNKRVSTASDYVFDHTLVSDGEMVPHLPNGQQWSVDYYRYADGISSAGGSYLTNGDREVEYLGYGLNFTKRLANRWMARGYVNFGEAEWSVPASYRAQGRPPMNLAASITTPPDWGQGDVDGELFAPQSGGSGAFTDIFIQSSWSANLNGMYQVFPDEPWGFNVAANLFWREGYPLPYEYADQTLDGQTWTVASVPELDTFRAEDVLTTDLRLEKDMPFSDNLTGTFSLDVFNVFNETYVLGREVELDKPASNHVTQTLSPRIYRLGFRVSWR